MRRTVLSIETVRNEGWLPLQKTIENTGREWNGTNFFQNFDPPLSSKLHKKSSPLCAGQEEQVPGNFFKANPWEEASNCVGSEGLKATVTHILVFC
jgi:hypothetical protein